MPLASVPIVERAFQLAEQCETLQEVRNALKGEGYGVAAIDLHLAGRSIRAQIRDRCRGTC